MGGGPPAGMRPPLMNGGPGGRGFPGGPPNGLAGGGGGMMGAQIPSDAQVLHDGKYFKLAWVTNVPRFVVQRESSPLQVLDDLDWLAR